MNPALLDQQDVAMSAAVCGESSFVKREAVAEADDEERARLRLRPSSSCQTSLLQKQDGSERELGLPQSPRTSGACNFARSAPGVSHTGVRTQVQ